MADDLRPAPRLPLDTSVVTPVREGFLDGMLVDDLLFEGPAQVSLLQTQTPRYYASAFDRAVYHKPVQYAFTTLEEAEAAARVVLNFFLSDTPKPPQAP